MSYPATSAPALQVSCYAHYHPTGANATVVQQTLALKKAGVPVSILSWPRPAKDGNMGVEYGDAKRKELSGVPYQLGVIEKCLDVHTVLLPEILDERVLTAKEWEWAVRWGQEALRELGPSLLHQHAWRGMWWILESAQRLGIPTVYTAHDFGIACLRTIMVMGNGSLCNGEVLADKCTKCIYSGRNIIGRANETLASLPGGEQLLTALSRRDATGIFAKVGGVRIGTRKRVDIHISRATRVLRRLEKLIVANKFAADVFKGLGVQEDRIEVIPWSHAQEHQLPPLAEVPSETIRLGFTGRLSPEKGIDVLLRALSATRTKFPLELHIAGVADTEYGKALVARWPQSAGPHKVVWRGWIPNRDLRTFYEDVNVAVFPSVCLDMTPTAMVDAISHHRPVICSDIPTMTNLVQHGVNGLVFPAGSVDALRAQIESVAQKPSMLVSFSAHASTVPTADSYALKLSSIYGSILQAPFNNFKPR